MAWARLWSRDPSKVTYMPTVQESFECMAALRVIVEEVCHYVLGVTICFAYGMCVRSEQCRYPSKF